ncbi:MAG TPA: biotin/lipoyl-containing protein [Candidatus Krumholzibacteria bacterium]|nr:biotin/lipoyl-containing protein [Candidatus Krumholzibacteria bacterium]
MVRIVLDGVARDVDVECGPEGVVISVDGRRHRVTEIQTTSGTVAFLVNHASYLAHASDGPAGRIVSLGGRNYHVARPRIDSDRPIEARAAGSSGILEAPMPGAIIAVNVAVGDRVKAGQPVVVLESMKMHNEITAPIDGVVSDINCKVGDQVSFGHVLAEIAPEESED